MKSTTQEEAVGAQTATGVPPTIESLSQIREEGRSRRGSTSSFFSVFSDASSIGEASAVTRPATPVNKIDKILADMLAQVSVMEKATEKQKNISRDVKDGLKNLRALLNELQSSRDEAKRTGSTVRTLKRGRSPGGSPDTLEAARNKKSARGSGGPPTIQVTDERGSVQPAEPQPSTSRAEPQDHWETAESRKKKKKRKGKKKKGSGVGVPTAGHQGSSTKIALPPRKEGNAPKRRSGAVLITPTAGKSFADVVRALRTAATSDSNLDVRGVSKTKDGAALVRTNRDGHSEEELSRRLQEAMGDQGVVKDMTPKITLEILDLDYLTVTEEVKSALNQLLGTNADRRISILGPNSRGQKMAICEFNNQDASKLLQTSRIKVGFVSCRVRARLMVPRCYKCLGYGHYRADCKGPDRRDCCWKCGDGGHKARDCAAASSCYLCSSQGGEGASHIPGSAQCAAFKAALTEAKNRQRTGRTGQNGVSTPR